MANGFEQLGDSNAFLLDTIQSRDPIAGEGSFPVVATTGSGVRGQQLDELLRTQTGASKMDPFVTVNLRGQHHPSVAPARIGGQWDSPNPFGEETGGRVVDQVKNQFNLPTELDEVPEGGFGLEQLAAGGIQPDPMKQGPIAETMLDEGAARVFDRGDDFMVAGPGWNDTFQDRGAAMSAFEEQFGGGGGQQQQQQQFLPALPAATPQPQQSGRGQQMQTGGQDQFSPSPSQRLGGQPQNPLGGIGMQQLGQLFQQLFGRGPQLGGFGGGSPLGPVPFAGSRGMMRRPLPPVQMRSPFGRF